MADWLEENRENYVIADDKAYTEDNILIYNIFIYTLQLLTEQDLHDFFTVFGAVRKVQIFANSKRTCARIDFAEATSAAKALKERIHRYDPTNSNIYVNACKSWYQPCGDLPYLSDDSSCSLQATEEHSADKENKNIEDGDINILSLNSICLQHIIQYLKIPHQISFARTTKKFFEAFQSFSKRKYEHFALDQFIYMTQFETRYFFQNVGECIVSVEARCIPLQLRAQLITYMKNYCPNVQYLHMGFNLLLDKNHIRVLSAMANIKELSLWCCELDDGCLQTLIRLPNLKALDLSENYEITGKYLTALKQLTVLKLRNCVHIQSKHMINICKTLNLLEWLDIRGCEFTQNVFDTLVKCCESLQILKTPCPPTINSSLAELPNLKLLELWRMKSLSEDEQTQIYKDLVKYKADQLQAFTIVAVGLLTAEQIKLIAQLKKLKSLCVPRHLAINDVALKKLRKLKDLKEITLNTCTKITNDGLLGLFSSCKQLRYIDVQLCYRITEDFIFMAVKTMKQRNYAMNEPLVVLVHGTSISSSILCLSPEYNNAVKTSQIKVVFERCALECDLVEEEE